MASFTSSTSLWPNSEFHWADTNCRFNTWNQLQTFNLFGLATYENILVKIFMFNLPLWNDHGDMVNFVTCCNYVFVQIIFKCGVSILLSSQKYVRYLWFQIRQPPKEYPQYSMRVSKQGISPTRCWVVCRFTTVTSLLWTAGVWSLVLIRSYWMWIWRFMIKNKTKQLKLPSVVSHILKIN